MKICTRHTFTILIILSCNIFSHVNAESSSSKKEFRDLLKDNSPGPIMIKIPAGKFKMGDIQQIGQSYEQPVHEVVISKDFSIGKYPITFEQYDKYTIATGKPPVSDYHWGRDNRPVINVNLQDAIEYSKWLSEQTGHHYRLPSEAEWEYAARAGAETVYTWGNEIGVNNANCNGCGSAWDGKKTAPVGQFPANAWGLHDVSGNTWDLTMDCWNYSYKNAPNDGSAWLNGDCKRNVLKGGSWGDSPKDLRLATRLRNYRTTRTVIIGFRVVRED